MSISGPQSGIRFSGLASGIDVESIINQLVSLEQAPIQRLRAQSAQIQARQTIFGQFKSSLQAFNTAASSLSIPAAFSLNQASVSDDTLLGVSVTDSAVPGTYAVNVTQMAKAHKLTSAAQTNTTTALGYAGEFLVNGKKVSVTAEDTLSTIAGKVNALGVGVSANVIDGGAGQAYLVFGATKTGKANEVRVTDVTGGIAHGLGLINNLKSIRDLSGTVASSASFTSSSATLANMTGSSVSGNLTLGTDVIAFDTATDSIQTLADKINATGNHSASVVTEKVDGSDVFRLKLDSSAWPANYADPGNLLGILGVTKDGISNEVTAATDALLTVDGVSLSSASNTLSNVVGGMTLTLKKEGSSSVQVSQDNSAIKKKFTDFQKAFNDIIGFIRSNTQLDPETYQTGALFGDQSVTQVESTLNTMLFDNLGTGAFKTLADIGFSLDDQGKLKLDETKLDSAIANKLPDLKSLMVASGSSINPSIKFVSGGSLSVASGPGGYAIDITQAATKGTVSANTAFTTNSSVAETLTFDGSLFGSGPVNLFVPTGSSLTSLIDLINKDSRLKDLVVASNDGGKLKVESKRFGTAGNFSIVSDQAEAADNSGIGTGGGVAVAGLDVAGTINGEAATGSGQFLLGKSGNKTTDGLQIQYTGTTTGSVGTLVYNRGVAAMANYRVNSFTDSVNGLLTSVDKTYTDQIQDIDDRISSLQKLISLREESLRSKFLAMEQAMSAAQAQGAQLSAMLRSG